MKYSLIMIYILCKECDIICTHTCVYIHTCEYKNATQLGCIKKPRMAADNYKDPFAFMKCH